MSASDPDGLKVALDNEGKFTVPSTQHYSAAVQVPQNYNTWKKAQAEGRKRAKHAAKRDTCTSWAWLCTAGNHANNAWDATKDFATDPTVVGIAAGVAVGVGCTALTAGAGAVACAALGGAVGAGVTGYMQGKRGMASLVTS